MACDASHRSITRVSACLPDNNTGILGHFDPVLQLGNRYGGDEDRLFLGNPRHITGCESSTLDIDPDTGVNQECHGSVTCSLRLARESSNQVWAAASGRVRYRSAMTSRAVAPRF